MEADYQKLTDEINSGKPLLVEFWGSWCPPCKMMEPILKQLAEEYKDRVSILKVNADKNPRVKTEYSLMGLPTIMVFQQGEEKTRLVGAQSKKQITAALDEFAQDVH